jgi:thymidylate synthase (FAD)
VPESQIKVELIEHMGTDLTVVNAARVSFDKESDWENVDLIPSVDPTLKEKDKKLIQYLAKHVHLSPFGHCFASFRVTAPVFVRAQLVKHEYLRMNEISRRYVDAPPELYTPDVWRGKPDDRKQGSSGEVELGSTESAQIALSARESLSSYRMLLKAGVAPEQARMVLPQAMMTSWWWSGSMDAFANMCHLRCKEDTQYETRLVANQIDDIMSTLYPVSWEALRMYAE